MKVLIVAKTRQGNGACIGAIAENGRSVRLIESYSSTTNAVNMTYDVGDVWEIDEIAPDSTTLPHVENVLVQNKYRLSSARDRLSSARDLVGTIEHCMPPKVGGIEVLYTGFTQHTPTGALYISERGGVPSFSTMFWRPDRPLKIDTSGKRIRYRYLGDDGGRTLTFVGFQEPVVEIAAHTLVRVSLAHWWRPPEYPEQELRCYLQLSGWFGVDAQPVTQKATITVSTEDPHDVLQRVFGYSEFRFQQEEVIERVLAGRSSLVIMPTGGGKSLCYQLPALLFNGLTVVVSPLISLMKDQVDQLSALGVSAAFLNSTLNQSDYEHIMQRVGDGKVKLLYLAPETLVRPEILLLLDGANVCCLAIDEAHCISQWGHDFRPVYRDLTAVRDRYADAACLALTATATLQVQEDIQTHLRIDPAATFMVSFDRPNLFLGVEPRSDSVNQSLDMIKAHPKQAGIIYCSTKKQVDNLVTALVKAGISALPYHAGLDALTRTQNQHRFINDDAQVIVATVAFGMGIDKPDVRFVIHHNLPDDLETYYQQIGRAGRDGLRADCLLLFSNDDISTIHHFIEMGAKDQKHGRHLRLEAMLRWVDSNYCRREQLLAYFGEHMISTTCQMCDNCLTSATVPVLDDLTVPAQKFLSCMIRTHESFGVDHIILVLRGSKAKAILHWGHNHLSTYGIGVDIPTATWKHLAHQFLQQGLIVRDMKHGQLLMTERGRAVLKGQHVYGLLKLPSTDKASNPPNAAAVAGHELDLFERLRRLRKELANAAGVPPFVIFHDQTLHEMATYLPQTEQALIKIHGVGQHKLTQYGAAFLTLIQTHCQDHALSAQVQPKPGVTATFGADGKVGARTTQIAQQLEKFGTIQAAALAAGIKPETAINHLRKYAMAGNPLPLSALRSSSRLPADLQAEVLIAFQQLGMWLTPVFEAFSGQVPYEELHVMRLIHLVGQAQ